MATDETELYKLLTEQSPEVYNELTQSPQISKRNYKKPDSNAEASIYDQSSDHRGWLVKFYIWYTIIFTFFVFSLVLLQADARVRLKDSHLEIVPEGCLNILVTGMFVQFIGLLKIVTERVWDFKELLAHLRLMKHPESEAATPVVESEDRS